VLDGQDDVCKGPGIGNRALRGWRPDDVEVVRRAGRGLSDVSVTKRLHDREVPEGVCEDGPPRDTGFSASVASGRSCGRTGRRFNGRLDFGPSATGKTGPLIGFFRPLGQKTG